MLMLTTPETIRMIAVALAADLMTNAFGEKAGRLMLEAERTRRDIGWGRPAILYVSGDGVKRIRLPAKPTQNIGEFRSQPSIMSF